MDKEKSRELLLKTPINELGLSPNKSLIWPQVEKLYAELDRIGVKFHPPVYFSDGWGCPDGVPVIGIPFFLATKELREIEKEKNGSVEDDNEILQILRHEAGHAFNYAYSLYKLPRWNEIFGNFERPYEENFAPILGNKKYVHHLEGWYAQKHPDEDFAETFAVLITPDFDWKKEYRGTRAYKKLAFAYELLREYADKPVEIKGDLDLPVEQMTLTVDGWYKQRLTRPKPKYKIMLLFYQNYPKKMPTRDVVVGEIKSTLLRLNYSVVLLPINRSIERIVQGVKQEKPDLIFNLCETFRNNDKFDYNVTALLEMLNVPFTGASSRSLLLSGDKYISKKIFSHHKIPTADFFIVQQNQDVALPKNFSFPLFVKPVHEDASIGIDINSFVGDEEALRKKVKEIQTNLKDDVLVEKYIEGREFFVSILGNQMLRPLQIVELDFSRWPKNKPRIYTYKAKIEENSEEYKSLDLKFPQDLNVETKNKIYETAIKVYQAFGARDYARIDMRLDKDNKLYVLEINLNPYLARDSETAVAAEASGLNYQQLIAKIIEAAWPNQDRSAPVRPG